MSRNIQTRMSKTYKFPDTIGLLLAFVYGSVHLIYAYMYLLIYIG